MRIFLLFLTLFFSSCSQIQYETKEKYLITFKSKIAKFSDIGFISKSENSALLNVFSLGKEILKLEMGNFISLNGGTPIPYTLFNSEYLNPNYPPETIKYIFLGKEIFSGKNRVDLEGGFEQKIDDIFYKVSEGETIFRDREIIIKIKPF